MLSFNCISRAGHGFFYHRKKRYPIGAIGGGGRQVENTTMPHPSSLLLLLHIVPHLATGERGEGRCLSPSEYQQEHGSFCYLMWQRVPASPVAPLTGCHGRPASAIATIPLDDNGTFYFPVSSLAVADGCTFRGYQGSREDSVPSQVLTFEGAGLWTFPQAFFKIASKPRDGMSPYGFATFECKCKKTAYDEVDFTGGGSFSSIWVPSVSCEKEDVGKCMIGYNYGFKLEEGPWPEVIGEQVKASKIRSYLGSIMKPLTSRGENTRLVN